LKETSVERLLSIAERLPVARTRDFVNAGIHPQALKRTLRRGLLVKMVRGLYVSKGRSLNFEHQVMLACKRVPRGVVCLKSTPMFHGLLPTGRGPLWMAINPNARKPVVNGQLLRLVRFGGDALTQGVISTRIDGVPVRVHSLAKTIVDCLKYRKRIHPNLALQALEECIVQRKCSLERLRHFAGICRVKKLVRVSCFRLLVCSRPVNHVDER
jgi:predicted transcriptional regulator of viral defense system